MVSIVEIDAAGNRSGREAFIRLPGQLARDDPAWVEPLHFERRQFLAPRSNPFFEHAEARFWLAMRGRRPVGRISAQIDRLAPPGPDGEKVGFFGMLDAADTDALSALLKTAEDWLSERQIRYVQGPFSLNINQTSGLLVDGFATRPYVMMDHHASWLGEAVAAAGYAKARDLHAYLMDITAPLPARERRIACRDWPGLVVRSLDMRRYAAEIATVTDIFNDAWAGNWGFIPLTEAETRAMAKEMKPILDPGLVKIAEIDGRPVAFFVLLPNVNEAIDGLGGRLLPFGWARLLWRLKVSGVRTGRVPLMGVRRNMASSIVGKTLPLRMIYAIEDCARARDIREIELSWILEDNIAVQRVIESLGGWRSKTYRIYEKHLA